MLDELWHSRGVSTLCVHGPYLAADPGRPDGAVRLHASG